MEVHSELMARTCKFDPSELKWVHSQGEPQPVELSRVANGSLRLVVGSASAPLSDVTSVAHLAPTFITLHIASVGHLGLQFDSEDAAKSFGDDLAKRKSNYERFEQYESSSVQSYFQYYAKLGNQQNMLQDNVRTGTYRRSIVENPDDFRGKTVMDVGAGSGILSFFAAQAGSSTVYAVEASSMAEVIRELADTNHFPGTTIEVVNRPLEAVGKEVPDKVDVLISEPIGTFLFNERMIETYLVARDRFLKPGGKMFPNSGTLCVAPFSDMTLHWEQQNKCSFWKNSSFYGLDLNAAAKRCTKEHFCQPIVDYVNPEMLMASFTSLRFDFTTITVESLHKIEVPFDFEINQPCLIHGLAGWFDAAFDGSNASVVLSTAPWCPGTHWYQIRFLLETPLAVNAGQHVEGYIRMEANNLQSYYVSMKLTIQGTTISTEAPRIDLKDPEYRFYTSPNAYCPPGIAGVWGQAQQGPATQAAGVNGVTTPTGTAGAPPSPYGGCQFQAPGPSGAPAPPGGTAAAPYGGGQFQAPGQWGAQQFGGAQGGGSVQQTGGSDSAGQAAGFAGRCGTGPQQPWQAPSAP